MNNRINDNYLAAAAPLHTSGVNTL